MQAPKVIRSFQLGEIIVDMPDDSYFKKGYCFTMTDAMLKQWKAGQPVSVTDSYCPDVMIPAHYIRAYVEDIVAMQRDLARN